VSAQNAVEIVGWGNQARWVDPGARFVARALCDGLSELGVTHAFAVFGGGVAPVAAGLAASPVRIIHTRHEAGAVFSAIEAHFATDRPALVVVTTGPGLFNALNGVMAARADGAKLLVISGATSRRLLGRGAVQETGSFTMPGVLMQAGQIFHFASQPETVDELRGAMAALASGWGRPGGFVAHLALPLSLQTQMLDDSALLSPPTWQQPPMDPTEETLDMVLDRLNERALLWVGHGARHAAAPLARLVRDARLPVFASPRAKGVFPEDDPLYIGVSGAGAQPSVEHYLTDHAPDTVLVVGSRLGEVTSFLSPRYVPRRGWIHVDVDPSAFGAAFPEVGGIGIVADANQFLTALHARALATGWYARRTRQASEHAPVAHVRAVLAPRPVGDVRPDFLMQVVQELVVENSDAVVMSEAGASFTWCNHALRFPEPGRYRTSAAWGSMGHFTAGAVGAAIAGSRRVVAIVGDGAMLMNNEINTAVAYGADVLWIVKNDAQLGLNEHGMIGLGMSPVETQLPRTDFAAFARCQGATGITVGTEPELADALERALATRGPVVLDVRIDRSVPSPIIAQRKKSLAAQGAAR
jgi:acetolactate synthase-1/2/3 large subunit